MSEQASGPSQSTGGELGVTVLFFATLKDRVGLRQTTLSLPQGAHLSDVKALLGQRYPALAPLLASSLAAINREFASDEDLLPENAEVAFFPPVSGGDF